MSGAHEFRSSSSTFQGSRKVDQKHRNWIQYGMLILQVVAWLVVPWFSSNFKNNMALFPLTPYTKYIKMRKEHIDIYRAKLHKKVSQLVWSWKIVAKINLFYSFSFLEDMLASVFWSLYHIWVADVTHKTKEKIRKIPP